MMVEISMEIRKLNRSKIPRRDVHVALFGGQRLKWEITQGG